MEVGFCGPGLMGAPMIRHLLAAGHRVSVWNRTRGKAEALEKDGALVVDAPRELAERVDTVFMCVLDWPLRCRRTSCLSASTDSPLPAPGGTHAA
ncbi:NAD(P)-binding domain-containing protein [Burkholderia ambifaria]|uniref:NAD(P)-binding domain-containing protein n=1 Tax=Burkholderia ambifaria TaxID=152480 RepID=UPI001E4E7EAD|nr:NAD(P)-binding domain-containing protein [Burkholderia ambifaria]UEP20236.1 NAD(P)-binding domain-containing protein [Burkholderia ambifaria]